MRLPLVLVIQLWCVALLLCSVRVVGRPKDNKKSVPVKPKPPTVKLNVDILPPLQEVLKELNFDGYLRNFVRMGVTETRLLLRLSTMDFQTMTMEWDEFSKDKLILLREKIQQLLALATVIEEPVREDLIARNKTVFGRIYLPNGVQSNEYNKASFGGNPPMGSIPLRLSKSTFECDEDLQVDYNRSMVIAVRGNCTFLQKALLAKRNNAAGLLVINTEDKLESVASGVGINRTISETLAQSLGDFYVVAVANNSYQPLLKSIAFSDDGFINIHIVPLKCAIGGHCAPHTPEEKALQGEVTWGHLELRYALPTSPDTIESRLFEFTTSNYGGSLPSETTIGRLVLPAAEEDFSFDQRLLCAPLAPDSLNLESNTTFLELSAPVPYSQSDAAVSFFFASRGLCPFDVKSYHAQQAGARVLILSNAHDEPLQRLGGMNPTVGRVGIPTILVTTAAWDFVQELRTMMASGIHQQPLSIEAVLHLARDDLGLDAWVEVAYTRFADALHGGVSASEEKKMQLEGIKQKFGSRNEIVAWVDRQMAKLLDMVTSRSSAQTSEL